jgi:cell division transport system permease protein
MNLLQALRYFLEEAWTSLVRSWKVSLLAILTIAVSLFVGGMLMLTTNNLSHLVRDWQARAKVVVYLANTASAAEVQGLQTSFEALPWVRSIALTDSAEAKARFRRSFPSLGGLIEGWQEEPLPASLELEFDPAATSAEQLRAWSADLEALPTVDMVDDDRDWVTQLSALVAVARAVGLAVGAILLGAAIFTIASVIRLTAYLYHEEIGIMRVVGATEFFIRGPFWVEGLLQGFLGGLLAVGGLWGGHAALVAHTRQSLWGQMLWGGFLSAGQQTLLVTIGAGAGLFGAVLSLRRERLQAGPPDMEV